MKITLTRLLALTLALLCLLSLAACGGKKTDSPGITAPTPLPMDAKDKNATTAAYVKENQALLEEVVRSIMARKGLSYFYFSRHNDGTVHVDELVNRNGSLSRRPVSEDLLDRLAATGFVGELTYNTDTQNGIVSFYTYMSDTKASHLFTYCVDEAARAYLFDGFFRGANNVSVTPIVGQWYYVEAK